MQWYEEEVRQLIGSVHSRNVPVFYGSSSIRLWSTLTEDIGPEVLNLGFGGSTLEACDYFFERIVVPVKPRSLILYAGDNDLGDGRTPEQTFGFYRSLAARVAANLGPIPFGFISVKPSPARFPIVDRIRKLNALVRADIEEDPARYYVDVFPAMLDASGKPDASLFQPDGLHMSRAGYRLWSRLLKPYLNRIFTA
jgi:lysophospholipase L1-like esterase